MSTDSANIYIKQKQAEFDEAFNADESKKAQRTKAADQYEIIAQNNFQIGEWQNENEVGMTAKLQTVKTSQGVALFYTVQLNYRFGLKPKDNLMIWFAPRIGYEHNPIIISEEEIAKKREGG